MLVDPATSSCGGGSGGDDRRDEGVALMIPGPVELDLRVQHALSSESESHMSASFAKCYQNVLKNVKRIVGTDPEGEAEAFVISGSGTLGWDQVAVNLINPGNQSSGDTALVIQTGYFGAGFADCLRAYGAAVRIVSADRPGEQVNIERLKTILTERSWKLVTVTHVDTSTGVRNNVQRIAQLVHSISPNTLIVVDGVCSIGCEEFHFDEWGIDCVLTASQKALGCAAGLSIVVASKRALEAFERRQLNPLPPAAYFASWNKWRPILKKYATGQAAYFATPATQLIRAFDVALQLLVEDGVERRISEHAKAAATLRQGLDSTLSIGLIPGKTIDDSMANGLTAIRLPQGLQASDLVFAMAKHGVVVAGGLSLDCFREMLPDGVNIPSPSDFIRIGHMGGGRKVERIQQTLRVVKVALNELLAKN